MQETNNLPCLAHNHFSVDCVILGFDGTQLKALLINRTGEDHCVKFHDQKLPGSIIYQDEELDEAANRVLYELTGIKDVDMMQFRTFGSKNRTNNPKDVRWLESLVNSKVERIITVAYLALIKIDKAINRSLDLQQAGWVAIEDIGSLAFDHNIIIQESLSFVKWYSKNDPSIIFGLLPQNFTALQLRTLFELIEGKPIDVRNFHKRMVQMDYVVQLEKREKGVSHRAARYYKFDRKIYNKTRR